MASSSNNSQELESGVKRAAQVNEAMLNVPWYADDSLFFVIRYADKVRKRLREVDFDDFMSTLDEITAVAQKKPEEMGSVAARYEKIAELKAHALGKVHDHPDLVTDFEKFLTNSRSVRKVAHANGREITSKGSHAY